MCLALLASLLPTSALAADNVPYIGANGENLTQNNVTDVTMDTTTWNGGWYVVNSNVTIDSRITVTGDVHLILADGYTLTASSGIEVSGNNSLTIYGQSGGTGKLKATGNNGGNLSGGGAGIGGGGGGSYGTSGSGGTVTISGGTITANGGGDSSDGGGAGIGGGGASTYKDGGNGGTVIILTMDATISSIGGGMGGASGDPGEAGQGIKPVNGVLEVYGELPLSVDLTVPENTTLTIPEGASVEIRVDTSLTVPEGSTLTNNGALTSDGTLTNNGTVNVEGKGEFTEESTLTNNGTINIKEDGTLTNDGTLMNNGTINNYGTIDGTASVTGDVRYPATVEVNLISESVAETEGGYTFSYGNMEGLLQTIVTVNTLPEGVSTVKPASPNQSIVTFTANNTTSINTANLKRGNGGRYEADVLVDPASSHPLNKLAPGTHTITASFDGIPGDETGVGLIGSSGSTTLVITKAGQSDPTAREGYTIDYAAETITADENYELAAENTATKGEKSLNVTPGVDVYVRKAGTETHNASGWTAVDIPDRPAAPTGLTPVNETVDGEHDGKITGLTAGTAYEISTGNGQNWQDAVLTGTEITGLAPDAYQVRIKATGSSFASASVAVEIATGAERTCTLNVTAPTFEGVYTGYAQPEAKAITITSTGNSAAAISGVTVSSADFIIGGSGSTVPAGGSIATWTIQPAEGLGAGTHTATITVAYNDGAAATAQVSFTVTRRSSGGGGGSSSSASKDDGPSTGDSDGWTDIQDEIADAEKGDTITIDMNGETEVPGEVFEEMAGKDVTVEFELEDGVSWAVNGEDVPIGAAFSDLDLGVSMDTRGIPVNVFNAVTGEYGTVQFTLAHDGEFGFTLTLTAPLGRDNAGYWANLYYYHEKGRELEFRQAARIGRDGTAEFRMDHASQYAVVIDDKSHEPVELPFTDVPEGAWYEDAVRYVYENGLMTGTSPDTFSPEDTTTRGQIVTILWRLAGSPQVNYLMDFSDVDPAAWYGEAVRWASALRIAGGYGDGRFGPDDPITREQLAVMLYQYAWNMGYDLTAGGMAIREYADYDQISSYALEALDWAVSAEIISGTGDGSTLSPQGQATRAQAAVMLMRFCELDK